MNYEPKYVMIFIPDVENVVCNPKSFIKVIFSHIPLQALYVFKKQTFYLKQYDSWASVCSLLLKWKYLVSQ